MSTKSTPSIINMIPIICKHVGYFHHDYSNQFLSCLCLATFLNMIPRIWNHVGYSQHYSNKFHSCKRPDVFSADCTKPPQQHFVKVSLSFFGRTLSLVVQFQSTKATCHFACFPKIWCNTLLR